MVAVWRQLRRNVVKDPVAYAVVGWLLIASTVLSEAAQGQSAASRSSNDTEEAQPDADFYVNSSTGSDSFDGLSATVDGDGIGPWATEGKAAATVGADSTVSFAAMTTYTGETFEPPDDVTYTCSGTGAVTIEGPSSGSIAFGIDVRGHSGSRILGTANCYFQVNAGGTPSASGGVPGNNITVAGTFDDADHIEIEFRQGGTGEHTSFYRNVSVDACDNCTIRPSFNGHGNPSPSDLPGGDGVYADVAGPYLTLWEGTANAPCDFNHNGGHDGFNFRGRNNTTVIRHCTGKNRWGGQISGFGNGENGAPRGTRVGTITRHQINSFIEDVFFVEAGESGDSDANAVIKLESKYPVLRWSLIGVSEEGLIQIDCNRGTRAAIGAKIAHNVIFGSVGASWGAVFQRSFTAPPNTSDCGPVDIVNNIFTNNSGVIWYVSCGHDGRGIGDIGTFRNNVVEADDKIDIASNCGGDGEQTVAYYERNFPAVVFDNIFDSDPQIVDEDASFDTWAEAYADWTTAAGSPGDNAATWLTHANGSGSDSTEFIVDDADYFQATVAGPAFGPDGSAGCYQVRNITSGWTACITAVNYSTNTLTLSSSKDWSDNDEVGYVNRDIGMVDN